ncbi:hypothetical protein DFJ43DRAFT_1061898 [Lentinula guzmanii]|uniref:Inner centromere protein ARK-binding domain-containing protein n=1 Tax=Lentinula guzmanii TaxID=2804957 RepID=A0AA38JM98_9AGAR|nr:hypothetical protein DFJ43DRAFT_1061898 [Lentinula guzmanii]
MAVQGDITQWANYVRSSMAFDPGRQYFQDQIQKHGFDFLDNYLDNILAKKKEHDVVDLLKTPGRKKTISKKSHASSKLKNTVSLQSPHKEKENLPSINPFQKALLHAKAEDEPSPPDLSNALQTTNTDLLQHSPILHSSGTKSSASTPTEPNDVSTFCSPSPVVRLHDTLQASGDKILATLELSMIAEDDESVERSHLAALPSQPSPPSNSLSSADSADTIGAVSLPVHVDDPADLSTSSSANTFHSIPLHSPLIPTRYSSSHGSQADIPPSSVADTKDEDAPAHPPSTEKLAFSSTHTVSRETPPIYEEQTVPLRDEDMGIGSSQHPPVFPSLPGPMPLRKSTRTPRDPSTGGILIAAATPGTGVGKRTSWLMKAREVKAMEAKPITGSSLGASSAKRKSSDMLGDFHSESLQDEEVRHAKASKQAVADVAPVNATAGSEKVQFVTGEEQKVDSAEAEPLTEHLGVLDQFKKTVQGLGIGKAKGKSLGDAAAMSALTEAKALAEAKVTEQILKSEEGTTDASGLPLHVLSTTFQKEDSIKASPVLERKSDSGRLSISDLVVHNVEAKEKEVFQLIRQEHKATTIDQVAAPVHVFTPPSGPVFNKPPPVFVPPSLVIKSMPKTDAPPLLPSKFSKPPSMSVGLSPSLRSSPVNRPLPISAHSTLESIQSDRSENIFGSQDAPAWLPSTQETELEDSQPQTYPHQLDEDDSWPIEEKLPEGLHWNFGGDSTNTWSSSEPNHTSKLFPEQTSPQIMPFDRQPSPGNVPGAFEMDIDDIDEEFAAANLSIDPGKPTVSLVGPKLNRSQSQSSMTSTSSSQSNAGMFSQATKFVNNILGTSKKNRTEVKSLQLAAAAAKKEQEEKDKKATVLKNMELRRQQAIQRKAEEERIKEMEGEKKLKEEVERRKREREDQTDKRPLKIPNIGVMKKDEDSTFKRKLPEIKKAPSKMVPPPNSKSAFKPTQKATGLHSSTSTNPLHSSTTSSAIAGPSNKAPLAIAKLKAKTPAKAPIVDEEIAHPSQHVQNQMAARVKAQLEAARSEPAVPSESIELPEVDSEYSDSDDEDRVKKFDPPHWAQSPELRQALMDQSSINPDNIFGPIRPLRMEEIFRSRSNRFRARTSSANWVGTDQLTLDEEREYARRMGYR